VFTGLVADLGKVAEVLATQDGVRLTVSTALAGELGEGDSIAVNGVCLTAREITAERFTADVMNETLERTNLGAAVRGQRVNLEVDVLAKHVEKLLAR